MKKYPKPLDTDRMRAADEIDELRATIKKVRALHRAETDEYGNKICAHCSSDGRWVFHPCPTVELLDRA